MRTAEASFEASTLTIEEFLEKESGKELLRFSTAGSVDDGKSTLIGRLLYDARGIYEDQLAAIQKSKLNRSTGPIDFSLLTDGLRAEREQGITIDVAYRHFSTPRRKFIIADTPGHEQYTRNMATGASTSSLAIVLIDARNGVLAQTRRHATISSLLGIPRLILAVNKMDLKEYSRQVFEDICADFLYFAREMGFAHIQPIPISALEGDNVAKRSARTPWYTGPSLLEHLESVPVSTDVASGALRFPVQYVIRPDQNFRGYAAQIASGTIGKGDRVQILPSGQLSHVASITTFDGELEHAEAPMSVTITLEDERDISRGDMIVHTHSLPKLARQMEANLVWMTDEPLTAGRSYLLKHTTQQVNARVLSIESKLDIQAMERRQALSLGLNDIGTIRIEASRPLFFDTYKENRLTGSFILIDAISNTTVAAGMIISALEGRNAARRPVRAEERHKRNGHKPAVLEVHNANLATLLERRLFEYGCQVVALDNPGPVASLLAAGVLVITPMPGYANAIRVGELALPADDQAAVDAVLLYLAQHDILDSGHFAFGEGI
ncbi:MAG: sulfate adenylyltransferase subunit CysN [Acidobacteria bacterium]|nr:sulfate adenylyltransferase subunit CysN [Acidobacteriota bacterium]